ncbi:MAG: 1-acyl-sn-glycerol-3-phosphate acyltransferase [Clostridiaceae bacterium]|nr:1-acyl-sn-glycerol-3-phosphate acyltransferase [Clostridiaceae bacterium]
MFRTETETPKGKNYIPASKHPVRRAVFMLIAVPILHLVFLPRVIISSKTKGRKGPMMLICNHNSILDPALIYIRYRSPHLHWLAKESLFNIPIATYFLKSFDIFPIDREANDIQAAKRIINELINEHIVGIFIEGGVTLGGNAVANPPKSTTIKLAIKKGIPIQLCSVTGKKYLFSRPKVVIGPTVLLSLREGKKLDKQSSLAISNELMRRVYKMGDQKYYNPEAEKCKRVMQEMVEVRVLDDEHNLWENIEEISNEADIEN